MSNENENTSAAPAAEGSSEAGEQNVGSAIAGAEVVAQSDAPTKLEEGTPVSVDVSQQELMDLRKSMLDESTERRPLGLSAENLEILKQEFGDQYDYVLGLLDEGNSLAVIREHMADLRAAAQAATGEQRQRLIITLGGIVYYGDGTGQVWPAMVVHVYGNPTPDDPDRNDTYVDLQVFKRKHICDVEKVAQHNLDLPAALNGWVFKA